MKAPPGGLVFPGGGIFFWFQAGAVNALARRLDLSKVPSAGASAGALAATLAACECDMDHALQRALQLSDNVGVFERGPWGLFGIWGPIIHTWLDELLPSDAADRCSGRVCIHVNEARLQPFGLTCLAVSEFGDKEDLIGANMASVHVPLFLNGELTTPFRGSGCVDGTIRLWGDRQRLVPPGCTSRVRISSADCSRMRERYKRPADFLRISSVDAVRDMMAWGEEHVDHLEHVGALEPLNQFRRR